MYTKDIMLSANGSDFRKQMKKYLDHEHRLVYRMEEDRLMVYSFLFHYDG